MNSFDFFRKRSHWERDNNGSAPHKLFGDGDRRPVQRKDSFNPGRGGKRPNVFSRLEPRQGHGHGRSAEHKEEPPVSRPKLSSHVTKEIPRREDVVAAQSDEQSRARNKRMFGSLLGTLNKFCQESRQRGQVEKKAIIEKKIEEQEMRERETLKEERRNMKNERKQKLMEVRLLEIKMERMQDLAVFEEAQKNTRSFIRTSAGPKIFFLPKIMNEKTTQLLAESQRQYDEELAKKREDIQKELVEVEERLQRDLERSLEEKPAAQFQPDGGVDKGASGDHVGVQDDEGMPSEGEDAEQDDEEEDEGEKSIKLWVYED